MAAVEKFRAAFNGFNREDVVNYLEYINNKNAQLVNQLKGEIEALKSQPKQDDTAALTRERDMLRIQVEALRAEKEALQHRCDILEQGLQAAQGTTASQEAPAPEEVPVPEPEAAPASTEAELECYRRAERMERMAKERADAVYRQANQIVGQVSHQVSHMTEQVMPIADQILAQLEQLQSTVCATKQSLQDAAGTLESLNIPDEI